MGIGILALGSLDVDTEQRGTNFVGRLLAFSLARLSDA